MSEQNAQLMNEQATQPESDLARNRAATFATQRRHKRRRRLSDWISLAVLLIIALLAIALRLSGGRVMVMSTGSMSRAIPVGSLIVDLPLHGTPHVGQAITFHPPGEASETYTHFVAKILPGGLIRTHNDLAGGLDPWTISRAQIVGHPLLTVPGLGWLLIAATLLIGSLIIWVCIGRAMPNPLNVPVVWASATLILATVIYRPFVRLTTLGVTHAHGHAYLNAVNAGLLPIRIRDGSHAIVGAPGAVMHLVMPASQMVSYRVIAVPHWWEYAIVGVLALIPVFIREPRPEAVSLVPVAQPVELQRPVAADPLATRSANSAAPNLGHIIIAGHRRHGAHLAKRLTITHHTS